MKKMFIIMNLFILLIIIGCSSSDANDTEVKKYKNNPSDEVKNDVVKNDENQQMKNVIREEQPPQKEENSMIVIPEIKEEDKIANTNIKHIDKSEIKNNLDLSSYLKKVEYMVSEGNKIDSNRQIYTFIKNINGKDYVIMSKSIETRKDNKGLKVLDIVVNGEMVTITYTRQDEQKMQTDIIELSEPLPSNYVLITMLTDEIE